MESTKSSAPVEPVRWNFEAKPPGVDRLDPYRTNYPRELVTLAEHITAKLWRPEEKLKHVEKLINRLFAACIRLPDMGGDLFARGIEVISRRFFVVIWLSKFEPSNMQEI